jgi:small subunit ribosomal protein S4
MIGRSNVLYVPSLFFDYKQLQNYISEAIRRSENSEEVLVQLLETRLDNVVYRLGLRRTRKECRQMVSHKHICVNEKIVNIASALVKVGDVISFKKSTNLSKVDLNITGNVFSWLNWNSEQNRGKITSLPVRKDIPEKN